MAEHEPCVGASDDYYTPPEMFAALDLTFDLDPAHPGLDNPYAQVPVKRVFTMGANGLSQPWDGLVWVNPPFGGRHGHVPWLRRFLDHANGIALVRAYTSSGWFHDEVVPRAETMLFPKGKTQFIRGTEMRSKGRDGREVIYPAGSRAISPGHGIVLLGMGHIANAALRHSKLGFFVPVSTRTPEPSA